MNLSGNQSFSQHQKSLLECDNEKSRVEDISFDLVTQMSQINISKADGSMNMTQNTSFLGEENKLKHTNETSARFYSQLFDVLRRRKKIPSQAVNLNKLELLDSKFDQATSTQVLSKLNFRFYSHMEILHSTCISR